MDHLSSQLQHRFLARLLSPEETLEVIKHLRECDSCREKLSALRSNKPGSVADTILPETPADDHPSGDSLGAYLDEDLSHPDKMDLEEHLRTCELCQKALADLKSFREELLQSPTQKYVPAAAISRPTGTSDKRSFRAERPRFFSWFNQPFVFAGVAATAALLAVVATVAVRSRGPSGNAGNGEVAIVDGNSRMFLGPNGIVNPPAGLPTTELATLNKLESPVWHNEPPALSPTIKDALNDLKRAPSVLLGQPSANVPFHVLSPIRTLIESMRPTFEWGNAPGAASYTVHVIADDRTQEEVATSPAIPGAAADLTDRTWTISQSLKPGKRYRWYVTAVIENQEIDTPGMEEPQAKFSVLSEEDLTRLDDLKKQNSHNRLLQGLLNLDAGLLDDAQNDFQALLDDPKQTSAAKEFLSRLIGQIRRLKES